MNGLTDDFIAIDTNVFGHLIDAEKNAGRHIHRLLAMLAKKKITLLVDADGTISAEYAHHLIAERLHAKQRKNEAQIIDYWMNHAPQKNVAINQNDSLWHAILRVIPESNEEPDRVFVYVAFKEGRILISNDHKHVIKRRDDLKLCYNHSTIPAGADVMPSSEAYALVKQTR